MFLFAVETTEQLSGYGLVSSWFENNLINWLLLVVGIIFLWQKYTPPMFAGRKQNIETSLKDAALAKEQGEQFLKEQEEKVANAEKEFAGILAEAKKLAAELKTQLEQQTTKDIADLRHKLDNQIANERLVAVSEMRSAAARAAIKLTEQSLPSLMNDSVKSKLLNQFMEQLDSSTSERSTLSQEVQVKTR